MADWTTTASLATAGGTMILAIATFSSTRSANRAVRVAEESLLAGMRPLLLVSRPDDPTEKVLWQDSHWVQLPGGRATAEVTDDAIYLAASLRNVGSGLALMHAWSPIMDDPRTEPADPAAFHRLSRDLYIAPNDSGYWQGAIRDDNDPDWERVRAAVVDRKQFWIDVLYGDQVGGQRTISRLVLLPTKDGGWYCTVGRHWQLDRAQPR